jgi:hypothetical protein
MGRQYDKREEKKVAPVKANCARLSFLFCFLSHFSLSSMLYSQFVFLSKSSPVSCARCFSPIASA